MNVKSKNAFYFFLKRKKYWKSKQVPLIFQSYIKKLRKEQSST